MRLAALSDTHGNAVAFEAVLADMRRQAPDAVLFLGDVTMRGPQPAECVAMLRELQPMAVVRGNYDHWFTRFPRPGWSPQNQKQELLLRAFEYDSARLSAEEKEWLGNLPEQQVLTLEGQRVELFHASPWDLVEITWPWAPVEDLCKLRIEEEARLVIFGHVHHAFVRQAWGRQVVNPGSVGFPFDGDNRASYAIIDLTEWEIAVQLRRVAYDVEQAIQIARERQMPDLEAFERGLRTAKYPYV